MLDRQAELLGTVVAKVLEPNPTVRNALEGSWLGHPVHPAVVALPIGSWSSALLVDFLPSRRSAAPTLAGIGLLSAPLAVATGLVQWNRLTIPQRRTALVHAAANSIATGCFLVATRSWRCEKRWQGRLFGTVGLTATLVGGVLGGHLAYVQGAGVDPGSAPSASPSSP